MTEVGLAVVAAVGMVEAVEVGQRPRDCLEMRM
jgi:hypothetical protein